MPDMNEAFGFVPTAYTCRPNFVFLRSQSANKITKREMAIGIKNAFPKPPSTKNALGNPPMLDDACSDTTEASQIAVADPMSIVDIVAINAGIFSRITDIPFTAPTIAPIKIITITASGIASAGLSENGEIAIMYAPTILESAKIEVAEKSILPLRTTKVKPHAIISVSVI